MRYLAWILCSCLPACSANSDVFRCNDRTWFAIKPSAQPDEIVIWEPEQRQIRLKRQTAVDSESWSYRAGGYALSGQGRRAVLVRDNRQAVRCTSE
jgi:hypothetical protein